MGKYLRTVETWPVDEPVRSVLTPGAGFSSNVVCELFSHHLYRQKLPTGDGVAKLIIDLVVDPAGHGHVTELIDVLRLAWLSDPDGFDGVADAGRRTALGALVRAALLDVAGRRGWPTGPIEVAHRICQDADWRWSGRWGRASTGGRGRRAWLEFDLTGLAVLVTLHVDDARGAARVALPMCRLPPTMAALEANVGDLSWTPAGQLRIEHRNGRDWWLVDPERRTITFGSPRAERGDPHGQFDLGMIYHRGVLVPRDVDLARYWLLRAADQNFTRAHHQLRHLDPPTDAEAGG